jgi:hypothetical protein
MWIHSFRIRRGNQMPLNWENPRVKMLKQTKCSNI